MTTFCSYLALVTIFSLLWGWGMIPWDSPSLPSLSLWLSLSLQYVLLQQGLKNQLCTLHFSIAEWCCLGHFTCFFQLSTRPWLRVFQEQRNFHNHPFMAVVYCQNSIAQERRVLNYWETARYQSNGFCEPVNPVIKWVLSRHRRQNIADWCAWWKQLADSKSENHLWLLPLTAT